MPAELKQKVTVFGGGLIGAAGASALAEAGHEVQVITRAPPLQSFDSLNWIFGNLASVDLANALPGSTSVVYSAGSMVPASQITSVADILAEQVLPVIDLAEKSAGMGVRNFIFISSGGTVYGSGEEPPFTEEHATRPINAYGMVKVQTEQALMEVSRRTGMAVHVLRVSNPYGPGQRGERKLGFVAAAIEAVMHGHTLRIWGDGCNTRDFVFIDDVGKAIARAVDSNLPGAILNIGSGRETTLLEVCGIVERVTGRSLVIEFEEGRAIDVSRNVLDVSKAREAISWSPAVDLEAGIAITIGLPMLVADPA